MPSPWPMIVTCALTLAGCGQREPLAVIPGALRLVEMANGEILVGTKTGEVWIVSAFGDSRILANGASGLVDVVSDPPGRYWLRNEDGRVYEGGLWSPLHEVATGSSLLLRGCEETRWFAADDPAIPPEASALGLAACDRVLVGTSEGSVEGVSVSSAAIRRVQSAGEGVLWVDAEGSSGCLGCTTSLPSSGVVDAIVLHLAPFARGELAWLDAEGRLWIAGG